MWRCPASTWLFACLLLPFLGSVPASARLDRPNVVLLLVDDLRWDVFGHTGYPVETPAIDRLAAEGVRFENSFVVSSLCAPSRATLLTGVYPHAHGVTGNTIPLAYGKYPLLGQLLQQRGYRTAMVGKWHLGGGTGARPGYDRWFAHVGETEYRNPLFDDNGRLVRLSGYSTDLLTDEALRFIDANRTRPFFLHLAYDAVHEPLAPARRHLDRYRGTAWPVRPSATVAYAPLRQRYAETLTAVDESVGRIEAALEQAGILDDTVLIFTSDNGYLFGEHERGDKRLFFEESIRVPLVVRYPRAGAAPGSARTEQVLNADLLPTILELTGTSSPSHLQGRSLVPVMRGEPTLWRTAWLYEYFRELGWPQLPTMLAVRTERFKYVEFPSGTDIGCYFSGEPLLFDLERDPYEMRNVAEDPAYVQIRRRLEARLQTLQAEVGFRDAPLDTQQLEDRLVQLSANYPFFAEAMALYYPGGFQGWDSRVCPRTTW